MVATQPALVTPQRPGRASFWTLGQPFFVEMSDPFREQVEGVRKELRVGSLNPVVTVSHDESVWGLSRGRGAVLGVTRPGFQLGLERTSWGWEEDSHASGGHSLEPNIGTHGLTNT